MMITLGFSLGIRPKAGGDDVVRDVSITLGFSLGIRPKAGGVMFRLRQKTPG